MRQITDEEGLPSLTVYDLYQDEKDYIWVATDKGLCNYDGFQFKYYNTPSTTEKSISRIQQDPLGNIWCSNTQNQLFQLKEDSLHLFETSASPLANSLLKDYAFGENNILWILSTEGLLKYQLDLKVWETIKLESSANYQSLSVDDQNSLWLISKNKLLQLYKQEFDISQLKLDQAPSFIQEKETYYLIQQQEQEQAAKIFQFDNGQLTLLSTYEQLQPQGILQNRENELWTYGFGGLYRQATITKAPKKILDKITISKVIQDREGNHWISSLGAGIYFVPQPNIRYFSQENSSLSAIKINRLTLDLNNNLILGTDLKEHPVFSPSEEQQLFAYQSSTLSALEAIYWDSSRAELFLYQQQLYRFKGSVSSPTASLAIKSPVHEIRSYRQDYLLLAGDAGLMLVRKDFAPLDELILKEFAQAQLRLENKLAILFPKRNCKSIFVEQDNQIWLGYADSLFQCKPNICQAVFDKKGNPIRVQDIVQTTDGTIWLASVSQGLLGLVDGDIQYAFNRENGLKSTSITSLAIDENSLWLGTDKGIQHLNGNRESFSTYDKQDGLVSNEIEDLVILDDEVWAASPKGLINFKQNLSSINAYPPPIYLRSFVVNSEYLSLSDQYQLNFNENNISIGFQGISYRAMLNFRYKYRLKGFSDVWYYIDGDENTLRFSALPPGSYQFEIRALNEDGVLSTKAIGINFVILRPFWQQWWFITSIVAALAVLISSLLWWRLLIRQRFLSRINILKMQALQAQMNPHFVFNALNAIQTLMLTDDLELAMSYLSKFAKLIRTIFNVSNLPALDLKEEIHFLKLYTDLEKLRFGDKVSIDFEIEDCLEKEDLYIPPLMIQPIIENSFKHGLLHKKTGGNLSIKLQKEGQYLYACIIDDGVGRAKSKAANSWKIEDKKKQSGLGITGSRLNLLKSAHKQGQNPKITDLYDSEGQAIGTQVEIWIPFQDPHSENL